MGFFEELPEPPPQPEPEYRDLPPQPEWWGPPESVAPGLSDERLMLFHTEQAAMTIDRFRIFPNGLVFTTTVYRRDAPDADPGLPPWELDHDRARFSSEQFLRLGIQFSDGTRWTNTGEVVARQAPPTRPESPPDIVVSCIEASGQPGRWDADHWLWPLPPPGALTFVAAWPLHQIDETQHSIDAERLRSPRTQATILWAR